MKSSYIIMMLAVYIMISLLQRKGKPIAAMIITLYPMLTYFKAMKMYLHNIIYFSKSIIINIIACIFTRSLYKEFQLK